MKKTVVLVFSVLVILGFTACGSTKVQKDNQELEPPVVERLFADWQYRGFGSEYPEWAEDVLLAGGDNDNLVILAQGESVDFCKVLANEKSAEESPEKLIAETWVMINRAYQGFESETDYYYIKMYQKY